MMQPDALRETSPPQYDAARTRGGIGRDSTSGGNGASAAQHFVQRVLSMNDDARWAAVMDAVNGLRAADPALVERLTDELFVRAGLREEGQAATTSLHVSARPQSAAAAASRRREEGRRLAGRQPSSWAPRRGTAGHRPVRTATRKARGNTRWATSSIAAAPPRTTAARPTTPPDAFGLFCLQCQCLDDASRAAAGNAWQVLLPDERANFEARARWERREHCRAVWNWELQRFDEEAQEDRAAAAEHAQTQVASQCSADSDVLQCTFRPTISKASRKLMDQTDRGPVWQRVATDGPIDPAARQKDLQAARDIILSAQGVLTPATQLQRARAWLVAFLQPPDANPWENTTEAARERRKQGEQPQQRAAAAEKIFAAPMVRAALEKGQRSGRCSVGELNAVLALPGGEGGDRQLQAACNLLRKNEFMRREQARQEYAKSQAEEQRLELHKQRAASEKRLSQGGAAILAARLSHCPRETKEKKRARKRAALLAQSASIAAGK
jgi:hypothetical protein